ncbi:hypothetical protein THIOKS1810006 [Thiocapsa sp. KS1]|nr:hypothetical protein [Thiocapsa sp. KS1]CRI67788.1 hypothetical protein THIOKS1810006 [Thiocapsa sp. KS1]
MSGEKEVRLREGEYRRLMNAARQVENEQSRTDALDAQLRQAQRQIHEQQATADRRRQAFERSIGNLSQELQATTRDLHQRLVRQQQEHAGNVRRLEQETSQRLAQQQRDFNSSIGQLDKRLSQRIKEQGAEFNRRVEQLDQRLVGQRREYLGLIAEQAEHVQRQFANLEQRRMSAQQYAEQWLADSRVILDYIEQNQQHQQFAPGELAVLKSDLAMSRTNIEAGHEQAAIATCQALYGKALKLQAEIEFRQMEWDTYYSEALNGARAQLAALEAQQTARWVFDTHQGSHELDAEIDYWSDGALSALKGRVEQSISTLEQQPHALTLDDLKQRISNNQECIIELETIVVGAKERLIASQLRVNIAQDLLDELGRSGWQLEDSTWQGETADGKGWKNSYHMKLKDLGGNEMISVIIPEDRPEGEIENRVQFAYYPHDNNDARFAASQTARLNETLAEIGLTQEPLQCVPGQERTIRGDEQRRDFAEIRAKEPIKTSGT